MPEKKTSGLMAFPNSVGPQRDTGAPPTHEPEESAAAPSQEKARKLREWAFPHSRRTAEGPLGPQKKLLQRYDKGKGLSNDPGERLYTAEAGSLRQGP